MPHHMQHAAYADADRQFVHPEAFAAFIHDDRHPFFMGRASKRTFVRRAVDDDRRPERLGEPVRFLVMAVDPDLRQVAAMDRGTVEVNAAITPRDNLVEEDIDRKRTSLNSSHYCASRLPHSA